MIDTILLYNIIYMYTYIFIGIYISADGNDDGIKEAFGRVATLINEQILIEEY